MFRIKICGITNLKDALSAAEAGADAIGLNFYRESPRYCDIEQARQIAAGLPKNLRKVGVFVGATADEIRRTFTTVGLEMVQIHGDEPPEFLGELKGLPVMRAFRVAGDLPAVREYLQACQRLACPPRMVLLDAFHAQKHGGTGQTLDWSNVAAGRGHLAGAPLVLAGGLTPENVAAAIQASTPWAVDTAGGVESSPGKKSAERVRAFVAAAKAAFAELNSSRFRVLPPPPN